MTQGLPVSNVVNVQVTLAVRAALGRNFGALLVLGTSTVITAPEVMRLYQAIASPPTLARVPKNTKQQTCISSNRRSRVICISANWPAPRHLPPLASLPGQCFQVQSRRWLTLPL